MAIGNLREIIPAFFTGPNGQPLTPEQIAQRQKVAQSLLQQASDTSPNAGGWASVLAKGLQGGISAYQRGRADDAAALNAKTDQANIEAGLGSIFGGGAFPSAVAQGASPTSGVATGTATNIPQETAVNLASYLTPDKDKSHLQFESGFSNQLQRFLADAPDGGISIYSGYRSPERQAQLWEEALKKYGSPEAARKWVAPPGRSNHNHGTAADLRYASDAQRKWAHENAARYGLNFRLGNEPWHIEPIKGWKQTPQQAIQAIAPIEQGDENPAAGIAPIVQTGGGYVDPIVAANPYPESGQIAPHDFTANPQLSAAAGVPMQGLTPEQFYARFNGQASTPMAMTPETQAPQQPQIDPRLAALNDQMLGGALSLTGRSEVAQALTGYFPDAPSANRAPITAQNNVMSQAPMQQPTGGVNPQVIASLLGPNASPQARQVGALLLGQHQKQQAAMQAQQKAQQELAQRQQVAKSMGIDPNAAMDTEAWKAAVAKANRDRSTVIVGNTVIDANTMHPIYEGTPENPTSVQEYEYGVRTPGYFERQESLKKSGATNVSTVVGGEGLSPGQKKIDENFADTYLAWNQGGFADSRKLIDQLGESLQILESGENVTGKIGLLPDVVRPFLNENGAIARENVEEVVQRSLREILGAQFTEKEGERLIARAFNPLLPPKENAKRVRRLLKTIGTMADAKQDMVDYFDREGTLRGYKGSRPTSTEINALASNWGKSEEEETGSSGAKTKTGVNWSFD